MKTSVEPPAVFVPHNNFIFFFFFAQVLTNELINTLKSDSKSTLPRDPILVLTLIVLN